MPEGPGKDQDKARQLGLLSESRRDAEREAVARALWERDREMAIGQVAVGRQWDEAPEEERAEWCLIADVAIAAPHRKTVEHAARTIIAAYLSRCPSPERDTERLVEALRIAELYVRENRAKDRDPVQDHALVREALAEFEGSDSKPPDSHSRVSHEHDSRGDD